MIKLSIHGTVANSGAILISLHSFNSHDNIARIIYVKTLCNHWSESGGIHDDIGAKSGFLTL